MKSNNEDINKKIKSYESLMHRVLKHYNVKMDYEDNLQEMRIVVWKALTNTNYKTQFNEHLGYKFTTYLYNLMANKLKDIYKVNYKIKLEPQYDEEGNKINKGKREDSFKYKLARPKFIEELSFDQQINALKNNNSAEAIRLKADLEIFYETLDEFEKKLWELNLEGWNQKEMVKKLKDEGIKTSRFTLSRKLKKINEKFKKFIEEGEI